MKTLKKSLGVVLALAMVIGCVAMAFTSFAASPVNLTYAADKTSVAAGDSVTVTVSLNENSTLTASEFYVVYKASDLTVSTMEVGPALAHGTKSVEEPADPVTEFMGDTTPDTYKSVQIASFGDPLTAGGAIAKIGFTVNAGVSSDVKVWLVSMKGGVSDGDFNDIDTISNGKTTTTTYNENADCLYDEMTLALKVPATGIDMASDDVKLNKGETNAVTATITPAGFNDGATVVWETSDASVATVADDGTVTAVANGEATITAALSTDASIKVSYKVIVKTASTDFATDVEVSDVLKADETEADQYNLALTGKFAATDIAAMFTNKSDVSDFSVDVTLDDGEAVSLENGVIAYNGVGEATLTVTVKAYNGSDVATLGTKTIKVTVAAVLPTSDNIVVSGDDALTVGGEGQMSVSAPANATDTTVTDVKYTSSDDTIVSIDETTGAYKALKAGEATLTYTAKNANGDEITATLTVTVTAAAVVPGDPENPTDDGGNGGNGGKKNQGANTGDAGVALAATLSLAAAAAFVFSKKRG